MDPRWFLSPTLPTQSPVAALLLMAKFSYGHSLVEGSITALTDGDGNSYNPSGDEKVHVVFDSFATNLLSNGQYGNGTNEQVGISSSNGLRDVYYLDLNSSKIYIASINYLWEQGQNIRDEQTTGGGSMNARISGDGTRIVFESRHRTWFRVLALQKLWSQKEELDIWAIQPLQFLMRMEILMPVVHQEPEQF